MKKVLLFLIIILLFSCATVNRNKIIKNSFYEKNNELIIDGVLISDFINKNTPYKDKNDLTYYISDKKLLIESTYIFCKAKEQSDIIFKNNKLYSFTLGEPWESYRASGEIPSGSIVILDDTGSRISRIICKESLTLNGVDILKNSTVYFYSTKNNSIAMYIPSEDFINGDLPIKGGKPVYFYENGKVAMCTTTGSIEKNIKPGSDVYFFPNGNVLQRKISKEITNKMFTIPENFVITYHSNNKIKSLTTKYDVPISKTGLKGEIKANTKVYFDENGEAVRFTFNEKVRKELNIKGNTEIIKYKKGKIAKVIPRNPGNNKIKRNTPVYLYENEKPMKMTINMEGGIDVFFDMSGDIITETAEIEKVTMRVKEIDKMYKELNWSWTGYDKIYKYGEELEL